jgi:hypothetical protein
MTPINRPALLKFLEAKNGMLFGKSIEIRDAIKDWLAYIPQSFPHYTQHTIEHSDEIILQISKLIFENDDPTQAVVPLSSIEAYILIAAAYLHDAGMVVSDKEKAEIIQSEEWTLWTIDGSGAKRWEEIKELRNKAEFSNPDVKNFVADLQTRFLIAEFVRRRHHTRASSIITEYQPLLGRFAFDDNLLLQAISNICVGHGLDKYDLEDNQRFPDRSDIMGESVNVRFLAILLRLGDLLDMRSDRACPLLLNAANPLPSDSLAHWTQYRGLTHRLTAPDKIEITAECENQEEHRFLQDWCQWLVNETKNANELMARCARHNLWKPPFASLEGNFRTITIQPSKSAKYIPNEWTFKLDPDVVYERLIRDLYSSENSFIRELLQNAFDATRCKLYDDLKSANLETPEYPTQVQEEKRKEYPVNISLETRMVPNELSGDTEERQFIIIEDFGIGMDDAIIEHYFLQVGHSFYTTEEFRRNYRFVGTSRFGLGFLSVFAVSDYVVVETYKPTSEKKDGPRRLVLTGPKNYLLTEKSDRKISGTRIEIRLQRKIDAGQLTKIVETWCKRVEFPIYVKEINKHTVITAEKPSQFIAETHLTPDKKSRFVIKSIPINLPGVYGEFYISVYVDGKGERWDFSRENYLENEPQASLPMCPSNLLCLHGIALSHLSESRESYFSLRVDYRRNSIKPVLSRERVLARNEIGLSDPDIQTALDRALRDHLSSNSLANNKNHGWKYKQRLSRIFRHPLFWKSFPKTIRIIKGKQVDFLSLDEVHTIPTFVTYCGNLPKKIKTQNDNVYRLMPNDLNVLTAEFRSSIFSKYRPVIVTKTKFGMYSITWAIIKDEIVTGLDNSFTFKDDEPISLNALPDKLIGIVTHQTTDTVYPKIILNSNHPFALWLDKTLKAFSEDKYNLQRRAVVRLVDLTDHVIRYPSLAYKDFKNYLEKWKEIPNLPTELYPPEIKEDDVNLHPWKFRSNKSFIVKRGKRKSLGNRKTKTSKKSKE